MGFMLPVASPRMTLMALWLPALPPAPTCEEARHVGIAVSAATCRNMMASVLAGWLTGWLQVVD